MKHFLALVLGLCLLVGCGAEPTRAPVATNTSIPTNTPEPPATPAYLTVSEAWQRAESLDGKRVRVRGYPFIERWMTLVACEPWHCDCNETGLDLSLIDERSSGYPPHDLPRIFIPESSLKCRGNECSMTCTPFNPTIAKEFELVGTLRKGRYSVTLQNLDLEASRQLFDEEWIPIETGRFTIDY